MGKIREQLRFNALVYDQYNLQQEMTGK